MILASSTGFCSAYPPSYTTLKSSLLIKNLTEHQLQKKFIETTVGTIAYYETPGDVEKDNSIPLILIHGNSCSKEYLIKQIDGLGTEFKIIAIDLPGHGESDNANNPNLTYSMPGYAKLIAEVINQRGFEKVILVGWSLGGHIAYEFMDRYPHLLKGVIVACAPAFELSPKGLNHAYLPTYSTPLGSKREPFTLEDVKEYITQGAIDFNQYPFLAAASIRADGEARYYMVASVMQGMGANERKVVETSPIPLGIILGEQEHAINNDYIRSLSYANLTMMETISGGHDCQWGNSQDFNKFIRQFVHRIYNAQKEK